MTINPQPLFLCVCISLLAACQFAPVPGYMKANFKGYCYSGKSVSGNSPIRSDGFYREGNRDIIFFPDGFCLGIQNAQQLDTTERYIWRGTESVWWGIYKIVQDTIELRMINHPSLLSDLFDSYEERLKIIGPKNLGLVYYRNLEIDKDANGHKIIHDNSIKGVDAVTFYPLANISKSKKPWLIHKRWIWCNEADYKTRKK
jgi:hypothetical protein